VRAPFCERRKGALPYPSALLAARPIPQETFAGHTLFLDRQWPVHLEAALLQGTFTW